MSGSFEFPNDPVSSVRIVRREKGRLCFLQSLRFSLLQFRLALLGSFYGICSRQQIGFFDEVAPALMAIGGVLGILKTLHFRFCSMPAGDDGNHSGRAVGPDVMPDDSVGKCEIVACQIEPISSRCIPPIQSTKPYAPGWQLASVKTKTGSKVRRSPRYVHGSVRNAIYY